MTNDDRTTAMALVLARDYLEKQGWRYSPSDIGTTAAKITAALKAKEAGNG